MSIVLLSIAHYYKKGNLHFQINNYQKNLIQSLCNSFRKHVSLCHSIYPTRIFHDKFSSDTVFKRMPSRFKMFLFGVCGVYTYIDYKGRL